MSKEPCVICGQDTHYDMSTHIDLRMNYVEGIGQLCGKCAMRSEKVNRNSICVPESLIEKTPNDFQLGEIVRDMYRKREFY